MKSKRQIMAQIKYRRAHLVYLNDIIAKMEAELLEKKQNLNELVINLEKDIELAIKEKWMAPEPP